MFDISFSELLVIGVVALIVLGPERLPKVARTAGHLLGRLQRYVSEVKAEIRREMHNEEIMKLHSGLQEAREAVSEVERSLKEEVAGTGQILKAIPDEVASLDFVEEPKAVEVTRAVTDTQAAEPSPQLELPLPLADPAATPGPEAVPTSGTRAS